MSYLLDTHTLFWWLYKPGHLSNQVLELIQDPAESIMVSSASAFEVTNKYRVGKWPEIEPLAKAFQATVSQQDMVLLAIGIDDAAHAGLIVSEHRDPFDRIIAAQSIRGSLPVLTKDKKLAELGAVTFW